jgi:hypothetical protein
MRHDCSGVLYNTVVVNRYDQSMVILILNFECFRVYSTYIYDIYHKSYSTVLFYFYFNFYFFYSLPLSVMQVGAEG